MAEASLYNRGKSNDWQEGKHGTSQTWQKIQYRTKRKHILCWCGERCLTCWFVDMSNPDLLAAQSEFATHPTPITCQASKGCNHFCRCKGAWFLRCIRTLNAEGFGREAPKWSFGANWATLFFLVSADTRATNGYKAMVIWRSNDWTWKVDGNASKDMVRYSFRSQKCRASLLSRIYWFWSMVDRLNPGMVLVLSWWCQIYMQNWMEQLNGMCAVSKSVKRRLGVRIT